MMLSSVHFCCTHVLGRAPSQAHSISFCSFTFQGSAAHCQKRRVCCQSFANISRLTVLPARHSGASISRSDYWCYTTIYRAVQHSCRHLGSASLSSHWRSLGTAAEHCMPPVSRALLLAETGGDVIMPWCSLQRDPFRNFNFFNPSRLAGHFYEVFVDAFLLFPEGAHSFAS